LSEIWEFIAEDSMARADEFIDRIDAKFHAWSLIGLVPN
jgi:hypothetical protein